MIIPAGFAQITHVLGGSNLPTGAVVTYGLSNEDDTPPDVLGQAYHDLFGNDIVNGLSGLVQLNSTICKLGPNETGPQWEGGGTILSSDTNPSVPPNVSMLIRKNTLLGGRHGRGRMFLPCGNETELSASGLWSNAYLDDFQGFFDSFYDSGTAGSHNFVLLHGDATAPTVITSLTVDARAATQRRRLRR